MADFMGDTIDELRALGRIKVMLPGVHFPVFRELRHYSGEKFRRDLVAGATLSVILPVYAGLPAWRDHLALVPHLASTAVAIPIIGMLEDTAITKTLAARRGQRLDPNQELLGMGAGNIGGALFGVTPGSSSFTRSAVNFHSGAATQMSSLLSSVVVLLVLLFVTPVFSYIPVLALAAHPIWYGGWRHSNSETYDATKVLENAVPTLSLNRT